MRIISVLVLVSAVALPGQDLFDGIQTFDLEYELLDSSDIKVRSGSASYQQEREDWTFSGRFGYIGYLLAYRPSPKLGGLDRSLSESTWSGDLSVSRKLNDSWEISLGGRVYDGFSDYRSIWIAEFYRQDFNFPSSGYYAPDPGGWSVTGGVAWSPSITRQVSLDVTYGQDTIAPGWTFQQPSNDLLQTYAVSARWQETLSPKLKIETSLSLSDVTSRQHRIIAQTSWHYALTSQLTLRAQAGGGKENPGFSSAYGGLYLHTELTSAWSVGVGARIYDDRGEIETSGFNTSAPGLSSAEFGMTALYQKNSHALRVSLSHFDTNYEPVSAENADFENLYRDRSWIALRLAYSREF